MKEEDLLFDKLFKKALSEWPPSLNLELKTQKFEEIQPTEKGYDLVRYKNLQWDGKFENYIVNGLYHLHEKIEEKYYDQPEEVLMCSLHTVIDRTIRDVSQHLTFIELKHLRSEAVKSKFEAASKEALEKQEEYKYLNWDEKDFQLLRDYFSANYPTTHCQL